MIKLIVQGNFGRRSECRRCSGAQPEKIQGSGVRLGDFNLQHGDWVCGGCTKNNFARRPECFHCGALMQESWRLDSGQVQEKGKMVTEHQWMNRDDREAVRHQEYLQRQERVFQRKEENWRRLVEEGRTCRRQGCGKKFPDVKALEAHIGEHNKDLKRRLICNQEKCGKKLSSQAAWRDHVAEHKVQMKARIITSVRSVLLLNKYGLLLEAFEREYKGLVGKPVPYKFMGFPSLNDFLFSLTSVLEVCKLGSGHTLLVGRPDPSTQHMAQLVARQMDNTRGYNIDTGQVLRGLGSDGLQALVPRQGCNVPKHLLSQLRELVELEGRPLSLLRLPEVFLMEYGYPLEWDHLGFTCLEDLLSSSSMAGILQLHHELGGWSVSLLQEELDFSTWRHSVVLPDRAQEQLKQALEERPRGLRLSALPMVSREWGGLQPEHFGCRDLLELCLTLPHLCFLKRQGKEVLLLAPMFQHLASADEVESEGELDDQLCDGGKIGSGTGEEEQKLKKDSVEVRLKDVEDNVRKTLNKHPHGILKEEFEVLYKEVVGEFLVVKKLNFFNISALLRFLVEKNAIRMIITEEQRVLIKPSKEMNI